MTDLFCGAGGSSTGATALGGIEVVMAANHWPLAIETHNANHPNTAHDCADISQVDPRRYPRTDILWASPECTNHSQARGKRRDDRIPDAEGNLLPNEAAERSRATMWDVVRFAEHHRYRVVLVENVVDAYNWAPFRAWLSAMDALGYDNQLVWLNSMHAKAFGMPAPQSRDRMYVVFNQRGERRPDVANYTRPRAWCPSCEQTVGAVQSWKREDRAPWGRYRAQYVYRCPFSSCRTIVDPAWLPASAAIDWSLPAERIGDRTRPLSPKTMARIREGLKRHASALAVPVEGREGKVAQPLSSPLRTMTARNETGLVIPLRANNVVKTTGHAFDTFAAAGNHHALLLPYYSTAVAKTTRDPFDTFTTVDRFALAEVRGAAIEAEDCLFRMFEPSEVAAGMAFPVGYTMLGNKRERVRLAGNAVTPPAARDLIACVAASLTGEVAAA